MINRLFTLLIWGLASCVLFAFGWLMVDVLVQGVPMLSLDFLTSDPIRSGRAGGIYPIIVSTFLILGVALTIVLPIGLGSAIWLCEFSNKDSKIVSTIRLSLDVLLQLMKTTL